MILTALRLELRRSFSLTVWLGLVVLIYAGVLAAFYPVIRDNSALLQQYLSVFPAPMLAAFGMEGNLADHGVFFNTYIGSMMWPIVAAIAGAVLGTRCVAADLDGGFLELPLATRITRTAYLSAGIAGQAVVIAMLAVLTVVGVLGAGLFVSAGFDTGRFLLAIPVLFLFGCAIASVATLLSVVSLRRGMSGGVVAGILLAMYLVHAISNLRADLGWLGAFSAFRYIRSTAAIDQGLVRPLDVVVLGTVAAGAWTLAVWQFRHRDLVV